MHVSIYYFRTYMSPKAENTGVSHAINEHSEYYKVVVLTVLFDGVRYTSIFCPHFTSNQTFNAFTTWLISAGVLPQTTISHHPLCKTVVRQCTHFQSTVELRVFKAEFFSVVDVHHVWTPLPRAS